MHVRSPPQTAPRTRAPRTRAATAGGQGTEEILSAIQSTAKKMSSTASAGASELAAAEAAAAAAADQARAAVGEVIRPGSNGAKAGKAVRGTGSALAEAARFWNSTSNGNGANPQSDPLGRAASSSGNGNGAASATSKAVQSGAAAAHAMAEAVSAAANSSHTDMTDFASSSVGGSSGSSAATGSSSNGSASISITTTPQLPTPPPRRRKLGPEVWPDKGAASGVLVTIAAGAVLLDAAQILLGSKQPERKPAKRTIWDARGYKDSLNGGGSASSGAAAADAGAASDAEVIYKFKEEGVEVTTKTAVGTPAANGPKRPWWE